MRGIADVIRILFTAIVLMAKTSLNDCEWNLHRFTGEKGLK